MITLITPNEWKHIYLICFLNTNITIKSGKTKFNCYPHYLCMSRMIINNPNPISVQNIVGTHQSGQCCPKNKPKNPTNPIITITAVRIPMMRSNVVIICSFEL